MQRLGYLLIAGGFLVGSYFAVRPGDSVPVLELVISIAIGATGVGMVRFQQRSDATNEDNVASRLSEIRSALDAVVDRVQALEESKKDTDLETLRQRIDDTMPEEIDRFIQARKSIAVRYGLQSYADVMSAFAAGERYLNRVWSSATDGYIDEAHKHLTMSLEQFRQARTELAAAADGAPASGGPAA